jgi:DNA-binding NarL/FixJ family response regulator
MFARRPVRGSEHRALILTSYDDDEALFAAILAGAAGYLLNRSAAANSSTR